jgi:Flp pilus assembly protein TadG
MVEMSFLVLVLVVLVLGLSSVWGVVHVHMGLVAVAEEAARAAALVPSAGLVQERGVDRGSAVGRGYALNNGTLVVTIDGSQFGPGGQVRARAAYRINSNDLPMIIGELNLQREQVEVVPRFRSLPP